MDTIYALSSGSIPAGVAVVRISGPGAGPALSALIGDLPEPRRAALRIVRRRQSLEVIDQGFALQFPGPRSFTGEDMAELHVHGGRAVVQAVFDALSEQGTRVAEPGEFSRRAFLNGKLDLTEVEGLADLIAAETEMQRRQAVGQARGILSERAEAWRSKLIDLRAEIEARLDFSDEGNVTEALPSGFWEAAAALRQDMALALASAASGERLRDGFRVAILGRPNAGKSSLLNAIARRDVAIVTEEAGTTRDVLEVSLDLGGYPVLLFDTAGLREAASSAEREGVRRAHAAGESADLMLWLEDCTEIASTPPPVAAPVWRVCTKVDLKHGSESSLSVSAKTGQGLPALVERIQREAAGRLGSTPALVARQRQSEAIKDAVEALGAAAGAPEEIAADLLRAAGDAIGRLSGRIGVEDVLDRLFSEFCIGK